MNHRDVKPGNTIRVRADGGAALLFGRQDLTPSEFDQWMSADRDQMLNKVYGRSPGSVSVQVIA